MRLPSLRRPSCCSRSFLLSEGWEQREREAAESGRKEQKQQTGETASYPGPLPTCPSAGGLIAAQTEDSGSHVGVKILRLPAADSGSSRRDMWVAQWAARPNLGPTWDSWRAESVHAFLSVHAEHVHLETRPLLRSSSKQPIRELRTTSSVSQHVFVLITWQEHQIYCLLYTNDQTPFKYLLI